MKEVSCRFFETLLRDLAERGIDPSLLVAGTPYTVKHLRDKDERVDWSAFVKIMQNGEAVWTREQLLRLGERSTESPLVQFIGVVARIRFSVGQFYHWVAGPKGVASQMFSCLETSCRSDGPGRVVIELRLLPGYVTCESLWYVSQGTYAAMPRMLGAAPAKISARFLPGAVQYRVQFVEPRGAAALLRRAVTWPFNMRQAADELADAHESLLARYGELESARGAVERQRASLATAYQLGQRIWAERDPGDAAATVVRSLVEHAALDAAVLEFGPPDQPASRTQTWAGDVGALDASISVGLAGRHVSGEVRIWPATGADREDARTLLELVAPTIGLALDNAFAYQDLATYQISLEQRVEERTRDLTAARDELTATVHRLEEVQASRERIFQNISHEIRTPLSLVLLSVDSVRVSARAVLDEASTEHLNTVTASARKLVRLVDELLLLAAGQERELRIDAVPVDLAQTLGEVLAGWRLAAEAADLTLTLDAPAGVVARVDPVALERMVSNLVSNAIKFTPAGGKITVAVEAGTPIRLAVRDTGLGIDEELRARLFGRFEQAKADPLHRGGSGIGLSIVRELVRAHGGDVTCEPTPGGGTTFVLTLPPAQGEVAHRAPPPRLAPSDFGVATSRELPTPQRGPGNNAALATIVIAEDDRGLADAIARLLATDHVVHLAHDGMTALALVEQHRPDLLITDVQMPAMDGIELTRRVVDLPGGAPTPVLVLSSLGERDARLVGLAAGAVDYLTKPFDPAELRARVRAQLAHRALGQRLHRAEKLASLGAMSAGLAHELRNPANGIVNAVGPLRELLPPELVAPEQPVSQLLEVMTECADQVAFLSRQLLGFRRSGDLELKRVAVSDVIGRAASNASAALSEVELRTRYDYTGTVRCSSPILVQVLVNLLENAAHAAGAGGWVEVAVSHAHGRVVIDVADSGPGVPPDLREKVFEPFYTTKPPGQGTGLGLATSRDLVHRHGGTLEIRVRDLHTVFTIELPEPREVS